ncbi:MAG: hypothetical protein GY716_16365 [bacterium]|nr:hypothetical protein [bacterium]
MFTTFEEINLYVYNRIRCVLLDGVIWCLGPVADESREYGLLRHYLGAATCSVCRRVMRVEK